MLSLCMLLNDCMFCPRCQKKDLKGSEKCDCKLTANPNAAGLPAIWEKTNKIKIKNKKQPRPYM